MEWFAKDNHNDLNSYIHSQKVARDARWTSAFAKHLQAEVAKLPDGDVELGEKDMRLWSEGMSFEWDHHRYFTDRFFYRFGNAAWQWAAQNDELFFALAGSHFNYFAKGCKSHPFYSLRVTVLLWDPFDFPSEAGSAMDAGYNAAKYLQDVHGYGVGPDGRRINQYAVWVQRFSNIGAQK